MTKKTYYFEAVILNERGGEKKREAEEERGRKRKEGKETKPGMEEEGQEEK